MLYLLLGCFLDAISMMILTMPFVAPLITAHGQSLVWFGVFVSMMIVIGAVTPPLGLNCYVMKAAMGKEVELNEIFLGRRAVRRAHAHHRGPHRRVPGDLAVAARHDGGALDGAGHRRL